MNPFLRGALAGTLATIPMTVSMATLHRRLPKQERRDPLPPRKIAMKLAEETGVKRHLDETQKIWLTLASHFAYGALAGALYPPFAAKFAGPKLVSGIVYGLSVWGGSYQGWLPLAKLSPPATKLSSNRNTLMIASHVVWGAALGYLSDRLGREVRPSGFTRGR